jgi:anaerobic magnesium-protoporphyrin IX monomethyl ester cyclase
MNILVINVSLRPHSPVKIFPIGLGYITTAIKNAGFKFDLLDIDLYRYTDKQIMDYLSKKEYDVVCFGCIVTGYKMVKNLSAMIKYVNPNTKILVGNTVASSIYKTLLTKTVVDIAMLSEGDETIVELLSAIKKGESLNNVLGIAYKENNKIIVTPEKPLIKDISSIPFIDFEIFEVEKYIEYSKLVVSDPLPFPRENTRALPINTARGCIANCGFCYHIFKHKPYRYRSAESIINEIKELVNRYHLNYILFWDELTFFSKQHVLDFANTVIKEKLHFYWTGQCRANLFIEDKDLEIMQKMKEAGCLGMAYSLESADEEILKIMNKKINIEQFSKQTELFHKAGINVWTSLVIGYPQETPETIKKTFDCCIENKIFPSAGFLLPQPGSQMYDYAMEHGFITDEEEYLLKMGDRQDLRLNMTSMSDEELNLCVQKGLQECNLKLNIGLDDKQLLKTQYYRKNKT